jgi:uncharacterized protein YyaL (SSP411 family)
MADQLLALFEDEIAGGLFTTGSDAERLLVRPREQYDNVTPSALSVAVGALPRLAALLERSEYEEAARRLLSSGTDLVRTAPTAVPALVAAADGLLAGTVQVAVNGRHDLLRHFGGQFLPRTVLGWADSPASASSASPLLAGKQPGFAYVCRAGACRLPAATAEQMDEELTAALSR